MFSVRLKLMSRHHAGRCLLASMLLALMSACDTPTAPSGMEAGSWWSQSWDEASGQRSKVEQLASGIRVAARSIRVTQRDENDRPVALSAKGNVLVQSASKKPIRAMGSSAQAVGEEVEVRGQPVAVKGRTKLVATSVDTVITIDGGELGVRGPAKFEAVESGVPSEPAAAAPTPAPDPEPKTETESETESESDPEPAVTESPRLAVPERTFSETKPQPKPKSKPQPLKKAPPPPVKAPAPPPKIPQMRVPEDEDLPIPGAKL